MAAVEVLQPHDPLKGRLDYPRSNNFNNHRFSPARSNENSVFPPGFYRSNRRKRSPQKNSSTGGGARSGGAAGLSSSPPAKNGRLVMGQVQILKRGEAVKDTTSLQRDGENNKKEIGKVNGGSAPNQFKIAERYAGSAFFTSPPPSSLPVPAFFVKKAVPVEINGDATSTLRRILKLDL